ncbi:ribosome silencing factor [Horticoccus luteus]|uniref:Ribosomal silencing factor RsfS n=1 Tax=Horticoccus luteus TaxID=2862869 RepID=A0A8F9TTH9_9BACT|nr:ribosome silencing factor [Horticoccus luteus]QYM78766.1 ribosome silencing factor [Horticoccus luteus]
MKPKKSSSLELVTLCCRALDGKKAEALRVLDVSELSTITDYLVIATGGSEPHLRALRVELEKAVDAAKTHILGMDTAQESGWLVVDLFDVMVHIFLPAQREHYGLERLWKDAAELPVAKLLAPPKPAAKRRAATAKPAATAAKPRATAAKPRAKKPKK